MERSLSPGQIPARLLCFSTGFSVLLCLQARCYLPGQWFGEVFCGVLFGTRSPAPGGLKPSTH